LFSVAVVAAFAVTAFGNALATGCKAIAVMREGYRCFGEARQNVP